MEPNRKILQIKVCGMRELPNLEGLTQVAVDWIGFIFYSKSPRYVEAEGFGDSGLQKTFVQRTPAGQRIKKVGVFVNEELDVVKEKIEKYSLDAVQLHGQETVFYCQDLRETGVTVIKAFSIDAGFSFTLTDAYQYDCDYFLFDAKGLQPGGNGTTFDWSLLQKYTGKTSFFLSGGLSPGMEEAVRSFQHPQFIGLDLNSGFELGPGRKDLNLLAEFIHRVQSIDERLDYNYY